ncbi:Arsenic efflux pump protein [Saccharolobus shibatae B12]|uniref:Arsenic efflux pump protein n=1 Tax=Saccharolobus shibatae (strain ATCC 51178 / DSM 5389 / JCM 8931 / NBRC 15437 / B12) TaxID=523848 RepID=A0A8F5BL29_SACSH|nr:anion transporter [Saccharolobus shibatae]QXJ27258.1 Arsenic efflux pump protein [Saccharolobus shibatae B12]
MLVSVLIPMMVTYGLIISRGITKIPPWASMFFGGILMVILGVISPEEALQSINLDVILFLITLFTFASALEVSGFLKFLAYKIIEKYKEPKKVLFYILLYSGLLSNLVTNDGISASWTPVILELSRMIGVSEVPFLYALAVGVTVGSVIMPTGNPQNLLIALESGIRNPFIVFTIYLTLPSIISLVIAYFILFRLFRKSLSLPNGLNMKKEEGKIDFDRRLGYLTLALLAVTVILFFSLSFFKIDILLGSLVTSSLLLLITENRRDIVRRMDWPTILFFIGLFIFTEGVLKSGIIQYLANFLPPPDNVASIMIVSILLSQVLSNVPLVAIYIPIMISHGNITVVDWLALAAGSTIAGNFTILGAASNVIISEASESRGGKGFNFVEFMKYTIPILIPNAIMIYLFLILFVR